MGWSTDWRGRAEGELAADYLFAVGKALDIATEFEQKCKWVLWIGTL